MKLDNFTNAQVRSRRDWWEVFESSNYSRKSIFEKK